MLVRPLSESACSYEAISPAHEKGSGLARKRMRIRPLGGGRGCLTMIIVSVIASVVLTVLLNLLF
ncbi:hypothetical protein BH23ACT4_BH23ACT4_07720 [soil metagenome]